MPELPEVETVCRGLLPFMAGRTIVRADIRRPDLRVPFPPRLAKTLESRRVETLTRRAKYILVHTGGDVLVLHLGMSGQVRMVADAKTYKPAKHDHMVLYLDDGGAVVFHDPRRFGMVLFLAVAKMESHPSFRALGPEPLDSAFTGKMLHKSLAGRRVGIKQALLDQHILAGVGNIYASEALHMAGIDPRRPAADLTPRACNALAAAICDVLERAIAAGGSSLKDYRQADGQLGYFQHSFSVYGRDGEPCPRCRTGAKKKGSKPAFIRKIVQAGRATYFCPRCQT